MKVPIDELVCGLYIFITEGVYFGNVRYAKIREAILSTKESQQSFPKGNSTIQLKNTGTRSMSSNFVTPEVYDIHVKATAIIVLGLYAKDPYFKQTNIENIGKAGAKRDSTTPPTPGLSIPKSNFVDLISADIIGVSIIICTCFPKSEKLHSQKWFQDLMNNSQLLSTDFPNEFEDMSLITRRNTCMLLFLAFNKTGMTQGPIPAGILELIQVICSGCLSLYVKCFHDRDMFMAIIKFAYIVCGGQPSISAKFGNQALTPDDLSSKSFDQSPCDIHTWGMDSFLNLEN